MSPSSFGINTVYRHFRQPNLKIKRKHVRRNIKNTRTESNRTSDQQVGWLVVWLAGV